MTAVRFVEPLAQALLGAGFDVELATGPGRGLDALVSSGFRVHPLPVSRSLVTWRNLHAVGSLRALIRTRRFDIVHAHTPAAGAVARAAARGLGVKVFYTLHGSLWGPGAWRPGRLLFGRVERRLGRWTDVVFAVNPEDARDCVRIAGYPEDRVRVLPAGGAGVAPEFFLNDERRDLLCRSERERLGLTPDARVVAYIGRTAAAKGMGTLAAAFASLARQEEGSRLLVVGGALEGERGAYSRERFLGEVGEPGARRVTWLGFQDRVGPFIAAADVVVLPSKREGFGMSLAEASAMGRPVVATDTRGARAVVEPGVTGVLVPLEDAAALAGSTLELLRRPEIAARMGREGRRRAEERFTREAVISAYLAPYESLRAERARAE